MDHELIHTEDNVDDLISDIHQLIDEEAPRAEAETPACEEVPPVVEEAAPAQEPAPEEKPSAHWTDRQKVPKHVAKLQNNQEEAYAQWLREQEEKGEEAPPVFEEELPKKKKKKEQAAEQAEPAEEGAVAVKTKKKGRFISWFCCLLVLLTLAAAVTAVGIVPKRPLADNALLHSDGTACILLAGTDDSLAHTDLLMLLTMNTAKGSVSLVSIPRDTIVMTGDGIVAIGTVYGRAGGGTQGLDALMAAVQSCVGFVPDGCLVLYPDAVTEFVDILGGELSGQDALKLLRTREEEETLDLTRVQTQRLYLAELMSHCAAPASILKAPLLLDALQKNSQTDLDTANLLWLARAALFVDTANAQLTTLPGNAENGKYVLDAELVVQSVNSYCNPYVRAVSAADLQIAALPAEE